MRYLLSFFVPVLVVRLLILVLVLHMVAWLRGTLLIPKCTELPRPLRIRRGEMGIRSGQRRHRRRLSTHGAVVATRNDIHPIFPAAGSRRHPLLLLLLRPQVQTAPETSCA